MDVGMSLRLRTVQYVLRYRVLCLACPNGKSLCARNLTDAISGAGQAGMTRGVARERSSEAGRHEFDQSDTT